MPCYSSFLVKFLRSLAMDRRVCVRNWTYVPGFWSWKGLVSTVRTLMIAMLEWGIKEERGK